MTLQSSKLLGYEKISTLLTLCTYNIQSGFSRFRIGICQGGIIGWREDISI